MPKVTFGYDIHKDAWSWAIIAKSKDVFGFFNPTLITLLALWRGMRKKPERWEIICAVIGLASLVWWSFVRNKASQAQFALYLAIVADACAAISTIGFVWKNPDKDRPFAWGLFSLGYGLGIIAISEHTFPITPSRCICLSVQTE